MYKHATEEAVNLYLASYQITQQDELELLNLDAIFTSQNPCNIYFICSRPKIAIDASYIESSQNRIKLRFRAQNQDQYIEHYVDVPLGVKVSGRLQIESRHPYNCLKLVDDEKTIYEGKSAYILSAFSEKPWSIPCLHHNVLYVGQSVDDVETVPTIARIKKHERLQEIYSDALQRFPDKEIYLILASFRQNNLLHLHGGVPTMQRYDAIDEKKFMRLARNPSKLRLRQKTTLCEAAFIRYFQPKYNVEYKASFPSRNHKSYSECYQLDINTVVIELYTTPSPVIFYSDFVARKHYHRAEFHMHTDVERRRMFNS